MATFKLDDRDIPFQPGETIIQAARRAGVEIPHYCWHPGLSVAANCRMCLVELLPPPGRRAMMLDVLQWDAATSQYVKAQKPKLVPACQQAAGEGMEVRSETSEFVKQARSTVQEFLLLNHPVDCPICDQAGECRLQDYWLAHQAKAKRMLDEPVHKPKAVRFGPTIVYDAERCILCTRCVRFCDEVAKDPVLDVRERGNLSEIVVAPGRELDHPYTLMTEFVCPVGALTAVDFRFKARVWFLRSASVICQGCATGCNAFLDFDPRTRQAYRHRPRENAEVNRFWMCDEGVLDYRRVHEGRVESARVAGAPVALDVGLAKAAEALRAIRGERLVVVLSAEHSSEDNWALFALGKRLGARGVYVTGRPRGEGDSILRHADKNPNAAGVAEVAGFAPEGFEALARALEAGTVDGVLALGSAVDVAAPAAAHALGKAKAVVALSVHDGVLAKAAGVVLPAASYAEASGTYVNAKGLTQQSARAFSPEGSVRPAWKLLSALSELLGKPLGCGRLAEVRAAMGSSAAVAAASSASEGSAT